MNSIFDTIALLWSGTPRPASRHVGAIVLTVLIVGATACGSRTPTAATLTTATTTATTTVTTTTTSVTTTTATTTRPTMSIDELVGAPGRRVHIRCVGQGATTVLLLSGFGGGSEGWAAVEPALAARTRVCSPERPGTGTSDPPTSTATFTTQATDLHQLLGAANEPGPYLVVGHSFGGAEAVTFASLFADEVTGLVLIDASPTDWPAALCAVPDDGSDAAATVRATCSMFAPTANPEQLDVAAAFTEASSIGSLGDLPMAVITATDRELPAGLADTEVTRLTDTWNAGQQAWLALSTAAHLVSVDDTGHHIEVDQPGVVTDEITRLLP